MEKTSNIILRSLGILLLTEAALLDNSTVTKAWETESPTFENIIGSFAVENYTSNEKVINNSRGKTAKKEVIPNGQVIVKKVWNILFFS
ncbi:hypothetical protein ACFL3G_09945 [Planctomycetota bacterium]